MAKKSAITDRSLILSKENFSKFTLITEDNIGDYYYNKSIFVVIDTNSETLLLKHTFSGRSRFIKGYNTYPFLWENTILESKFWSRGESKEEYKELMDNFYPYIKEVIKNKQLYGIKL